MFFCLKDQERETEHGEFINYLPALGGVFSV